MLSNTGNLNKTVFALSLAFVLSGTSILTTSIEAKDSNFAVESLCKKAKVTMRQAEKKALAEVPGRVRRIELETDDGVLIYEIIICQGKTKKEVKVDANSGKILEIDKKLGKCKKQDD